jgi:hypothetical protein
MGHYQIIKEFWFDAGHRMYNHDLLRDRGASLVRGNVSNVVIHTGIPSMLSLYSKVKP